MQEAHVVLASIAPLNSAVPRIVLALDVSENRALNCVAHIGSHKPIAIAPASEFTYGVQVVFQPWSKQGVAGSRLRPDIEGMHDSGIKKGFLDGSFPIDWVFWSQLGRGLHDKGRVRSNEHSARTLRQIVDV